jgi:hypothetical protein
MADDARPALTADAALGGIASLGGAVARLPIKMFRAARAVVPRGEGTAAVLRASLDRLANVPVQRGPP